jgi:hypothetical protein
MLCGLQERLLRIDTCHLYYMTAIFRHETLISTTFSSAELLISESFTAAILLSYLE